MTKISEFGALATAEGTDTLVAVDATDTTTKKVALSVLLTYLKNNIAKADVGLTNVQDVNQQNADNLDAGTVDSARLPTVPLTKGGTGATSAATARTALGLVTIASTGSYSDLSNKPSIPGVYNAAISGTSGTVNPGDHNLGTNDNITVQFRRNNAPVWVDYTLAAGVLNWSSAESLSATLIMQGGGA